MWAKNLQKVLLTKRFFSSFSSIKLNQTNLDKIQLAALDEKCYLVNESDQIIGSASKRECHLVKQDGTIPLHRAFSVFLFNPNGDLLLQKRSSNKITYPDCYTNACCSHPLEDHSGEDDETNNLGIKRAAQRRLNYELGIPVEQMPLERMLYLMRIHYFDVGNGKWGEHEIDHILILRGQFDLKPNENEVNEIKFIPQREMNTFARELRAPMTPWFYLILKDELLTWWKNLDSIEQFVEHSFIHKPRT